MGTVRELPPVLQLDIAGNPQAWITYEDSAYHYSKDNVAWAMGVVDFDIYGGTNAKTGERTVLTINTIIAVRGELNEKAMKHYNRVPLKNETLFRRDHHICAYCGNEFPSSKLTRDHVHPTSRGGLNKWTNVVTACESCNKQKDNHLLEEISMDLLYVPYEPNRAEWLLLRNRRVLADQMEFLMKRVPKESRLHDMYKV
jgi:5-methylcytosine-specific restriction endonuclease McrA